MIQEKENVSSDQRKLIFAGVDTSSLLSKAGIFYCESLDFIGNVGEPFQDKEGLPPYLNLLNFADKKLEELCTLRLYYSAGIVLFI
ncbi:uncharacterized protein LOC143153669 [Ptiloglossa arizonensis]|uniref:uncharacterized protein LOC143153669 n=1 Tax=Ptiloglossa arizonensis TaxID=3350558 RepID=UPI003FA1601D